MDHEDKDPSSINVVRKNPKGQRVGIHRKHLLIELYKYKTQNEPSLELPKLIKILTEDTGIGYSTVLKTVQKYLDEQGIKRKIIFRMVYSKKIGIFGLCKILQKIHSFWFRHKIPTSKNVLPAINADPSLPSLSVRLLKNVLKDLHFEYTTYNAQNKPALTETEDIVLWRRKYIEDIRRYRNEGKTIYYLEETWVNVSSNIEPSSEGKRIIVAHIGSVEGFVEGALLCFEPKTNTANYHEHINSDIFNDWFCGILPLLKENSVIVFDNASYYSNHEPTKSWKKDSILKWFEDKGIVFDRPMVKFQLIEKVKETRLIYDNYRRCVQEAMYHNKMVLRLPPYHWQLNPIQLAWEVVTRHANMNICTISKLDDMRQLFNDGVKQVTAEMWADYVHSSIKYEDKLWDLDFTIDKILEETVTAKINLVTSSESSSD